MLVRRGDPADARRTFIELSLGAAKATEACLEAALNTPGL
jgi:hypothetical protein